MKKQVSISINTETFNKAKALGINVSKASENYLNFLIEAIENHHSGAKVTDTPLQTSTPKGIMEASGDQWNEFRAWLKARKYNARYASTLFNYAQQYQDCLFERDLSRIRDLPNSVRPNMLKALSALAKFTGRYDDWKALIKSYGLVWTGRSSDDIFIDRLTKIKDPEEIWTWIKNVKLDVPDLCSFVDLMAVSGLRFIEAVNSYNLIIDLEAKSKLGDYYREEALEHFRFKDMFLRKSKKAFVSFVPSEIVSLICQSSKLKSADAIQQRVRSHGLLLRFGDIRETTATYLTKFLKPPEIDFLQGRVSQSVFMSNYFNPALISDLKARAFQGVHEIQEKIK